MKKKWLAILGSPRRNKNTEKIMDYYIDELERNNRTVNKIILSEIKSNICDGCQFCIKTNLCKYEDDITKIINEMKDIEGIILASPSYNYNVTAHMKIFLDRLFCLFRFGNGRWDSELDNDIKSIIIGVCAGPNEESMGFTMEAMKRVLLDHGLEINIEHSYYGTRRVPVENNTDIKEEVRSKVDELLLNMIEDNII